MSSLKLKCYRFVQFDRIAREEMMDDGGRSGDVTSFIVLTAGPKRFADFDLKCIPFPSSFSLDGEKEWGKDCSNVNKFQ